ncbi:MAG TPA: hypothetical protein VGK20_12225 [Candidatus Binatia bacterium]
MSNGFAVTVARIALAAALVLGAGGARRAEAGSYDPVLVIGQAISTGQARPTLLSLVGAWSFDDILQVDFPLNVVVSQGEVFVRYSVGSASGISGSFAGLSDGLTVQEVPNLEASGSADSSSSLVKLTAHQMTLALPPIFLPGPVTVVMYAKLQREGILFSNRTQSTPDGGS